MSQQILNQLYEHLALDPQQQPQIEVVLRPLAERLPDAGVMLAGAWLRQNGGYAAAPVLLHTLDQAGDLLQALFWLLFRVLSARQQALFYASAAFAPDGSFHEDALLAVWGGEIFNASMRQGIQQDLDALVPALLMREEDRYFLPPALHPFAEEILAQSGDTNAARRLHFEHYRDQLTHWDAAETTSHDPAQYIHALAWVGDHLPADAILFAGDILEFTQWSPALGDQRIKDCIRLAASAFANISEITTELLAALEKLGDYEPLLDRAQTDLADWARGEGALRSGRLGVAATYFRKVLNNPSPDADQDTGLMVQVYASFASVRMQQEQFAEAVALLQTGLALTEHPPAAAKRYVMQMMESGGESMIAAWQQTAQPLPSWL